MQVYPMPRSVELWFWDVPKWGPLSKSCISVEDFSMEDKIPGRYTARVVEVGASVCLLFKALVPSVVCG